MNNKPLKEKDLTPNRYTVAEAKRWGKSSGCIAPGRTAATGGFSSIHNLDTIETTDWLTALRQGGASENTLIAFGKGVRELHAFLAPSGRTRPVEVTADDLVAWRLALIERALAPATVHLRLRAVRKWFAWLEARGELFASPAASLVLAKPSPRLKTAPSAAEMKRFLAAPNAARPLGVRDRALLETAYAAGLRREELQKLDIHDVNLDAGTVRVVGKGRKERVAPLTKPAVKWLSNYTQNARPALLKEKLNQPALWIDYRGDRLSLVGIGAVCKTAAKAAGVRISPHGLRRACATHLLQGGAHPFFVKELLGHATLASLANYLRLTITDLKAMHAKSKPGR